MFRPTDRTHALVQSFLAELGQRMDRSIQIPSPFCDALAFKDPDTFLESLRYSLLYYAMVCQSLLRFATAHTSLAQLSWRFPSHSVPLDWLDELAEGPAARALENELGAVWRDASTTTIPDLLQPIYEGEIPATVRLSRGEFYTPAWLADYLVGAIWEPGQTWVDPTAGSGGFLLAVARQAKQKEDPRLDVLGIESNPWAVLAAAANSAFAAYCLAGRPVKDFEIPVVCLDLLTAPAPAELLHCYTRVVGNPPWVLWDRLSQTTRQESKELWFHYGLMVESGMASILGGGKKDLSMLLTYLAADKLLSDGGRLGLVLTQSVFKASGSARGFRRWTLPDGELLEVTAVDDLSKLRPFPKVSAKSSILFLRKGGPTRYPVPYRSWREKPDGKSAPLLAMARPADPSDIMSAWCHVADNTSEALNVFGRCDYVARLGANTGGANGIYWLRRLETPTVSCWTMRNLAERGRHETPVLEVELEPTFLFPLLMGKDVQAWHADSHAWILMVQDPTTRRGIDPLRLTKEAPRTHAYLARFESRLRERAAFRRYFTRPKGNGAARETGPFYSMFNVGLYTLSPWKVVWNRMGHRLAAAVIGCVDMRPVIPQETHCFFPVDSAEEGYFLAALLNSPEAQAGLESVGQVGGKSFATPSSIHRLRLQKYNSCNQLHKSLAAAGSQAALAARDGDLAALKTIITTLVRLTKRYWKE